MKYFLFAVYFFVLTLAIFPEYQMPLRTQKELKYIILNEPVKKIHESKNILSSIYYYSKKMNNEKETFIFFKNLTKMKKNLYLYPLIYYNMSKYRSGDEKKKLLLKSKNSSINKNDLRFSLFNLVNFYRNNVMDDKKFLELFYIKKLILIQSELNDFFGLEKSFYNAGIYYKERNDYLNAINHFVKSIEYSKKINGYRQGNSYLQIARIFYLIDKNNLTKKYLSKALDYSTNHKDKNLLSNIYLFYSNDYYDQKIYDKALKYILKAENNLGNKDLLSIKELYFLKAKILLHQNQRESSKEILKHLISSEINSKSFENFIHIISYYTEILIEENILSEAEENILKIDDIYAPYYRYYYYFYYLKAMLFEKKFDTENALIYYNKTLESIEKFFKYSVQNRYFYFKEDIERIYKKISLFTVSIDKKKSIKKIIYLNELKNFTTQNVIINKNTTISSINKIKKFVFKNENSITKGEETKKIANEIKKLDRDFFNNYKRYKFSNLNINKIQKRLSRFQLLIKYIIIENSLYVVYITRNNVRLLKIKNVLMELSSLVKSFSNTLDDFTKGKVDYLRVQFNTDASIELYKILLKKILEKNSEINELLIIPDGVLFKIPFEALITSTKKVKNNLNIVFSKYQNFNYLIEKYSISYYFSIFQLLKINKKKKEKKKYKFLFYGDPIISTNMKKIFHPLPSIKNELNSIKQLFKNEKTLSFTKEKLKISNFKKFSSESEIIHIATHYIKNREFPYFSSLLFSMEKDQSNFCFAHNIYKYNLNNSLVILSACESSENNLIGLEGLNGIVAAFKKAGTKSVIVSLWPVDEYNSTLLPIFYKYLKNYSSYSKSAIANALRSAKLEFLKQIKNVDSNLNISYSHPFLWSNFIIYNLN